MVTPLCAWKDHSGFLFFGLFRMRDKRFAAELTRLVVIFKLKTSS
jgi:hypothetical protein